MEQHIAIIQVVANNTFVIRCAYCDGSGRDPMTIDNGTRAITSFHSIDCRVCKGRGQIRVKSDDELVAHGRCHGTGRDHASKSSREGQSYVTTCWSCKGLGCLSMTGEVQKLS